ncbi:ABC transporter ATP-binding protein [Magnetospirillum gryphiswaldense]|uniref:ATP-binding component of ABC superfamily n=2 Tax=Magnetospirillum gryphiswaldense TaxID=55518 RepID=V6F0G4_MAGGM|nr:ABC transporter ATP-binding protein [Magnetospirillum gryphiswaldense]AVM73087.1 putative ABC transporter ATP-binding protein [Magnetospirillum gryphiswaldense MSR-1]AVM76990.1 putative ABC transporter ATP-binding protein [Magnetospirillum gryphiswaldense]CAM75187.1 ABC-type transport system involved in resistance to organic solvents, ATPase component [Magnetospirillum gryphiswaldense MSR-1]CDK98954.1 ATP-binding component of ABC superfamily [Magnetospirillum gryphiswaldense MSR-1 v2]
MSETPSVEVIDLNTHYGDRQVLKNVSLTVKPGEIFVIMGGSGSGKTTLLNHLLGLLRPSSGTIRILGQEINALSALEMQDLRTRMGVAFQSGALFSSMSVGDNIALPLREHTNLDETTIGIVTRLKLEVVSLAGFEYLMPSELSGGMIKRAAFARAIVMDPRLLFCDEPSAGLDPVVASSIDDLILRLRDAMGMSIIVVTHDLDSTFKIADRICVLDKGEVLALDTVDAIRNSPNERIQNLLNRRTEEAEIDPDAYLRRLLGEKEKLRDKPESRRNGL